MLSKTVQIIVNVVRQTVKYGIEIIQAFSRELVAARHEKNEKILVQIQFIFIHDEEKLRMSKDQKKN